MGATTIEWCEFTFNPWRGCAKVQVGCRHCFAERYSIRQPDKFGTWGPDGRRVLAAESYWRQPLRWNDRAEEQGVQYRVFCGSLMDWCEDREDLDESRDRLFRLIGATPHLTWLLLTKRPYLIEKAWRGGYRENVWVGYSASTQNDFDSHVDSLLAFDGAAVRFLSLEPLLEPMPQLRLDGIGWVIVGGESGPGARPMDPDWVRWIRDDCVAAGVPFTFKQWGSWCCPEQMPEDTYAALDARENLAGHGAYNEPWCVGKKRAGRLLDGREWNQEPEVKP